MKANWPRNTLHNPSMGDSRNERLLKDIGYKINKLDFMVNFTHSPEKDISAAVNTNTRSYRSGQTRQKAGKFCYNSKTWLDSVRVKTKYIIEDSS